MYNTKCYFEHSEKGKQEQPNMEGVYFAIGVNGSKPGQAYKLIFDNGTCLAPIMDSSTGLQIVLPENAGKEYTKGQLKNA